MVGSALFIWLIAMIVSVGLFVFWIIELINCLKSEFKGPNDKIIWILVLLLGGPLGAIIYRFVGRGQKRVCA